MTFDVLLVALAALVVSNVVLLVAAARSGVLDLHQGSKASMTERDASWGSAQGSRATHGARKTYDAPSATPARPPASAVSFPPAAPAASFAAPAAAAAPNPVDVAGEVERLLEAATVAPVSDRTGVHTASPGPDSTEPQGLPATPLDDQATGRDAAPVTASGAESPSAAVIDRPEIAQAAPKGGARTSGRRSASTGKRGRRFTLPSIEVDHERTERVVLSLLSGDDEPASGQLVDAWERLVGGEGDAPGDRSAVVVALALDGLDAYTESGGRDTAERLVGGVLDAIRRSARGSDRVASVGRGRFRVLLVDADGEVASRFVSRVRELADRRISLSAAPVRVAAGWAEATSAGSLDAAVRAAEDQRRRNGTSGSAAHRDIGPA